MRAAESLRRLDRLQRSFWFKVVATAAVVALGVAFYGSFLVKKQAERAELQRQVEAERAESGIPADAELPPDVTKEERELIAAQRTAAEATERAVQEMLSGRADPTDVGIRVGAGTLLAVAAVWLGVGLTSLALLAVLGGVALPLAWWGAGFWRGLGEFVGAIGMLAFAFVILMELLRLLVSGPWAVTAIARNVVNEAVRIKVSAVFIVLLVIGLAALPGLLEETDQLRYRVQTFLQYGTGGTFWVIAVLVLFLSVSTVAFEQRDKVIWQTMTKPVAPWQYLLGKWLGVAGVAGVLLCVSATGVFLFVEYLRDQRATGEVAPYVAAEGLISEDRRILQTQVLTASRAALPEAPELSAEGLRAAVEDRLQRARQDPAFREEADTRDKLAREIQDEVRAQYFAIEDGKRQNFAFQGLKEAKDLDRPVTLRYRIDVGGNDPRQTFKITLATPDAPPQVKEVPFGQTMAADLSPAVIGEDGTLRLSVMNGDIRKALENPADLEYWGNGDTLSFPPDGLKVYYPVGSYRANFFRVMLVLWLKLAFLAMVGVCASTFLSFPVASLVAFGVFLMAESAGFLFNSLEYFASADDKGNIDWFKVAVRAIAVPVSRLFYTYADLRPTASLVDGRVVSWGTLAKALAFLGGLTAVLYAAAVAIFRKRELATYSGQ